MRKINFIIVSQDSYLKSELKSLLSSNGYSINWYDDSPALLRQADILMKAQYILVDDSVYGLPDSLLEKTNQISYIFIEDQTDHNITGQTNCRHFNREHLISILQKYKYGILFDKELVA